MGIVRAPCYFDNFLITRPNYYVVNPYPFLLGFGKSIMKLVISLTINFILVRLAWNLKDYSLPLCSFTKSGHDTLIKDLPPHALPLVVSR